MEDQWDYTRRPRKNECRELYLPGRNLERVDLDDYEQLDTLWVNNNKIKSFTFLQPCFRLRCLFAQNNQIKSLENLGSYCRFLVVLLLQGNRIRDLEETIIHLRQLQYVQELNLFDNPIHEETDYRITVIYNMPSLRTLDRHEVTDEERRRAYEKFEGVVTNTISFGRRIPPKMAFKKAELSVVEKDLQNYVENLKMKTKRQQEAYEQRLKKDAEKETVAKLTLKPPPIPRSLDFLGQRRAQSMRSKSVTDLSRGIPTNETSLYPEVNTTVIQSKAPRTNYVYQSVKLRPKSSDTYLNPIRNSTPTSETSELFSRRETPAQYRIKVNEKLMRTFTAREALSVPLELETRSFIM